MLTPRAPSRPLAAGWRSSSKGLATRSTRLADVPITYPKNETMDGRATATKHAANGIVVLLRGRRAGISCTLSPRNER